MLPEGVDPALLTSEGFDYDGVMGALSASGLEDAVRSQLGQLLEAGQNNPALRDAALAQIRAALGL